MKYRRIVLPLGLLVLALGIALAIVGRPSPARAEQGSGDQGPRTMVLGPEFGEHGWLGVQLSDVSADKARELKLPAGTFGAYVDNVEEKSPAAQAGIQKGDVITEFDGERVRSVAELRRLVRETPSGRGVEIKLLRNGQPHRLSAKLESRAPFLNMPPMPPRVHVPSTEIPEIRIPGFDMHVFMTPRRLGVSAEELNSQLADYFGVKQGKGVLVREVDAGTPAEKAGLKAGDVIVKVDDTDIATVGDLRRAIAEKPDEKRTVTLTIVRNRQEQKLSVDLEPARHAETTETTELRVPEFDRARIEQLKAELAAKSGDLQRAAAELRQEAAKMKQQINAEQLKAQSEAMRRAAEELRQQSGEINKQIKRELLKNQQELEKLRQNLPQQLDELRRELKQMELNSAASTV